MSMSKPKSIFNMNRRELLRGGLALSILPLVSRPASAAGVQLAIITGANSPVNAVSRAELKRLFLGDPTIIGGQTLVPINATPLTPDRVAFDKAVLEMTPDEVTKAWVDRRIRGIARPPRVAPDVAFRLKIAAAYPGAITYVPVADVTPQVKVLLVDGKKPAQPGYPVVG